MSEPQDTNEAAGGGSDSTAVLATRIVKDFTRWEPNVTVAVWGRGKATAGKSDCPMDAPPGAKYKGDCQDCEMFMGVRFRENHGAVYWGDRFKACCWAKVANEPSSLAR